MLEVMHKKKDTAKRQRDTDKTRETKQNKNIEKKKAK